MELFSPEFFSALLAIVVIDLVLAGDNAIVIALAARNLPDHLRKRAIIWGSVGAVVVRSVMTIAVVWLLKIPGLLLVGGLALLWIAYKLLHSNDHDGENVSSASTFLGAMKTIVVADAIMGVDNVLAVAGAAHGSYLLVVLGLVISIPIVVWGSTFLLSLTQRFPAIVYLGSAVLVFTGVKMALNEPLIEPYLADMTLLKTLLYVLAVTLVLFSGFLRNQVARMQQAFKTHARTRIDFRRNNPLGVDKMEKVLVPVDGSQNSMAAIRQVVTDIQRNPNREIVLLHVQQLLSRHAARFVPQRDRDDYRNSQTQRALAEPSEVLQKAGVPFSVEIRKGDRAATIAKTASELQCHKVVLGTARKNSLTRLVENSVTARLLQISPVPVQVVMGREVTSLERIGIPTGVVTALTALVLAID
jgi:YjbE family integral membrane protein